MGKKRMWALRATAAVASIIFAVQTASFMSEGTPSEIRLAVTSGVGGRMLESWDWPGMAKLNAAVLSFEPDVVLDAGGFFYGSAFSDSFNGETAAEVASVAGYDAMGLSPRDWLLGKGELLLMERLSGAKILASNVRDEQTGEAIFSAPYITKRAKGRLIGVYGVIGQDMYLATPSGYLDGIVYSDALEAAR
ncbi:MAG: hypothetical protein LBC69_03375, partial [Eubacteriaceae bacterium]|nr:hypothetical protein [Eubacteriaceae bacterium]